MIHTSLRATPRQQKRELTFERIIEVATRAVSDGGWDALTMQRLARELGFAVGAVYRYFPGKDALLVAVQRRIIDTLQMELDAALARADAHLARSRELASGPGTLLKLWVVVQVYEAMARARPREFGLLSLSLSDPRQLVNDEDARQLLPAMLALFETVGAVFTEAAQAGALREADSTRRTLVLWSSAQGALQLRKLERFSVAALDASGLLDEAVSALLVGWGANAAEVKAMRARAQRLSAKEHS